MKQREIHADHDQVMNIGMSKNPWISRSQAATDVGSLTIGLSGGHTLCIPKVTRSEYHELATSLTKPGFIEIDRGGRLYRLINVKFVAYFEWGLELEPSNL